MKILNYECKIKLDIDKPDGTLRKLIDSSKIIKVELVALGLCGIEKVQR